MNVIEDKLQSALHYLRSEKYSDAIAAFRSMIHIKPELQYDIFTYIYKQLTTHFSSLELRALLAELHISVENYQEAFQELEDCFEINPHFSKTYSILGKIHHKAGLKLKVRQLFESAVGKRIFDTTIIDILPKIYIELNCIEKNISFFKQLIIHFPNQHNYYKILSELHVRNRDYNSATESLDQLLDLSPSNAAQLIPMLRQIVNKAPRNVSSRQTLIKAFFHSMKPKQAVQEIKDTLKIQIDHRPEMIQSLKKMTQVYPNNSDIILLLSTLLIDEEDFSESLSYLQSLYKHSPDSGYDIKLLCDSILDLFPGQIMALSLLSDIHFHLGEIEDTLHYTELMIDMSPENAYPYQSRLDVIATEHNFFKDKASFLLAKLAFSQADYTKVQVLCTPLLNTPLYLDTQMLLAEMFFLSDNPQKAFDLLILSLKKDPYHWSIHSKIQKMYQAICKQKLSLTKAAGTDTPINNAMLNLSDHDSTGSIEILQTVAEGQDTFRHSQLLLARSFIEAGRFELALNTLERSCAQDNSSSANTTKYMISTILCLIGKGTHAIHYLDQILATDVHFHHAIQLREHLQNHISIDLRGLGIGGLPSSVFGHDNFISFTVDNPENHPQFKKQKNWQTLSFAHSHNNDGVTHFLQGNYKAAEQAFKLSYQMDPNLSIAYNNLSYLYTCSGEHDKALELCDKGLNISPKNSSLCLQKGLIYFSQENYTDALKWFEQSYKLNPKNHHCILLIGDTHFLTHNIKAAFDYWKQSCDNPIFLYFVSQRTRYLQLPDMTIDHWLLPRTDLLFTGH